MRLDLRDANLSGADLSGADLSMADLSGADLSGTNLGWANLSEADLTVANLRGADLREANLRRTNLDRALLPEVNLVGADLREANLREVYLSGADLRGKDLSGVDLFWAFLGGADLREANLREAKLIGTDLRGANLSEANMVGATLWETQLIGADVSGADLRQANLRGTNLNLAGANFARARSSGTIYSSVNLSAVKALETMVHVGPSTLGTDTLIASQGMIPDVFLRGCGLSDWEIKAAKLYNPNLHNSQIMTLLYEIDQLRSGASIQINPLFISYAHHDASFVDALERKLSAHGIRFWRDIHDLKAGRLETQIDRAVRMNPTVLLVLSERSVESDWVEWEAGKARELEKQLGRDVLCPIALDDAWKSCRWPGPLRKQITNYRILDFSRWQVANVFEEQFSKLVEGLTLFYPQTPRL